MGGAQAVDFVLRRARWGGSDRW